MCLCCSSKQTASGITEGWHLRCDSASLTILRTSLLSFLQLFLKHLSVIHRICWPSSRCNHSLCSLSFATSTPPCWSLLSLSLSISYLWPSLWRDCSLAGPGCFIEQPFLICLFIERPGRQRACQPVPIAPHLSSCLSSYSLLVPEPASDRLTHADTNQHVHTGHIQTHTHIHTYASHT